MVRPRTVSDEQILSTACRCFLEHGPSVSTETIASQLGVSPQALLKRFQSKRELLLASVLPPETAPWIPTVESGPDHRPVREQLTEIVHQLADYYLDIAQRMSVLQFAGFSPQDLQGRYSELPPLRNIRLVASWFQRAADQGLVGETDYQVAAMTVLSALHGPAMLARFLNRHPTGHTTDEYVDAVVELILNGLNGPEELSAAVDAVAAKSHQDSPTWSS